MGEKIKWLNIYNCPVIILQMIFKQLNCHRKQYNPFSCNEELDITDFHIALIDKRDNKHDEIVYDKNAPLEDNNCTISPTAILGGSYRIDVCLHLHDDYYMVESKSSYFASTTGIRRYPDAWYYANMWANVREDQKQFEMSI